MTPQEPEPDFDEISEPVEIDTEEEQGLGSEERPVKRVSQQAHKRREYSSNFCAALRAVLVPDGFDEKDISVAMTVIDAARRADHLLSDGSLPSERRRFQCATWLMELYRRRETLPFNLSPEDERREKDKLSRSWRRYWSDFHLKQCRVHTGYIERDSPTFQGNTEKAEAGYFIDSLTDFVHQVMERARELEARIKTPVYRFEKARSELIAEYRAAHVYAPDWVAPVCEGCGLEVKEEGALCSDCKKAQEPEPESNGDWKKPIRRELRAWVMEARTAARSQGLTEDEEVEFRLELQKEIEALWTGAPDPTDRGKGSPPHTSLSSVTRMEDTSKNGASAAVASADSSVLAKQQIPEEKRAISAWKSVGAARFLALLIDDTKPPGSKPEVSLKNLSADKLATELPNLLRRNSERQESLMIRPDICYRGVNRIIHLDDLRIEQMPALEPFCFLHILTSDGNGQGFIALDSPLSDEAFSDLRDRLLDKLNPSRDKSQVNKGSSGSLRWPGSFNKKPSRRAPDGGYPLISIVHVAEGRKVTPLELEHAGLLALPTPKPKPAPPPPASSRLDGKSPADWPDLNYYLQKHWKQDKGRPDRSSGEEAWVCACARKGFRRDEIISRLSQITLKGQGRRDDYVAKTVDNGLRWLQSQPDARPSGRQVVSL